MPPSRNRFLIDAAILVAAIAVPIAMALRAADFSLKPLEDAAMLMQYADNVAAGYGFVWYEGGPRVDGATDFLSVMLLAGLRWIGMGIEPATRFLAWFCHVASLAVLAGYLRYRQGLPLAVTAAAVAFVGLATGPFLIAAYFVTSVYALGVTASAIAWQEVRRLPDSTWRCALLGFSCLFMGLARPEGVLVSVFLWAAVLFELGFRRALRALVWSTLVMLILGGAYFLTRWSYFGHPLPNPFYVKGGGTLHWPGLRMSVRVTAQFCYPFLVAMLVPFFVRGARWKGAVLLMPLVASTLMWVLMSDQMNFARRFQYPTLFLAAVSFAPAVTTGVTLGAWNSLSARRHLAAAAFALIALGAMAVQWRESVRHVYMPDGRYPIGVMLNEYKDKDYRLVTTEAGLLPFYSRWDAVDAWGLNDPWISQNGGVTLKYLNDFDPHVIVFHATFSPATRKRARLRREVPWHRMILVLEQYATAKGYVLAAAFGHSPHDTMYYYVAPDFEDSAELVQRIRETEYQWGAFTLEPAHNYAVEPRPARDRQGAIPHAKDLGMPGR